MIPSQMISAGIECDYQPSESALTERKKTLTTEERKALIHFHDADIQNMSEEEIFKRIDALREIADAPHFHWRTPVKDEHRETVKRIEAATLNGHAQSRIALLEQELLRRILL